MKAFTRFFENVQQDLKAFAYWCLVFTFFRICFIAIYSYQLNGNYTDVPTALYLGLRLSLKTAGIISLLGFAFTTLPKIALPSWPAFKLRLGIHSVALVFFSICFFARIPYYKIFNAAFNLMLINGVHDDWYAILLTAVEEYQLWWRLPLALVFGAVLAYTLRLWLEKTGVVSFDMPARKGIISIGTMVLLAGFCVFVRYRGAFGYASSVNWESAARLKSNLLNEAILDDGQALYRVHSQKKKRDKAANVNITSAQLRQKIALTGGNEHAATIDEAYLRTVQAPKLAQQPSNVVVILGESFGKWPFMPKFSQLGLAPRTMAMKNSATSAHINVMLAHGSGTISAVNGLLTGLPDEGLYANYQAQSFNSKYATGIGYIMKQLDYKTVFWYGGFPGWQNLKNFVLAQSFDEFHCADEFGYTGGNAWGTPDGLLFEHVNKYIATHKDEKLFHVVLTTTNHPPYTMNVDAEGFPRQQIKEKLPADIGKDEATLTELGHIWYADKTVGDFVEQAQKDASDSLFVITGDHSERFSFAIEQDAITNSAIPCIFYGKGVQHTWFGDAQAGSHMQLAGTLAEIVGHPGFKYSAMMENMFRSHWAFNHKFYTDGEGMELLNQGIKERLIAENAYGIAAWRVMKSNEILDK